MQPTKSGKRHITAERYTALSRVGTALMSELDESRLLHLIAETACELTDASFAAFTLRPVDEEGLPLVASEGNLFHLAAVVGVTPEQEEIFRRMPLGGEGLLAPIFRQGVPVLVEDALLFIPPKKEHQPQGHLDAAREAALAYAHGYVPVEGLQSMGVPRGHPMVRSFLGVPLLNRDNQVRGGLLLGHTEPGKFTQDDEALLVGLAAQAAVALENARLYRAAKMRAQELNTIFESIAEGIALVDNQGKILRENSTARRLREILYTSSAGQDAASTVLQSPDCYVNRDELAHGVALTVANEHTEGRDYIINATPLRVPNTISGPLADPHNSEQETISGAVVVWLDVTESRRLLAERRILAETEARLALLQTVLDELPSSVYLVRGQDARLVLANRAATTVWGAPWPLGQPMADFLKENSIRIFSIEGHMLAPEELAALRAVQNGETVHHHQEVIRHPDGTTLPVLVNAVALDAQDLNVAPSDPQKYADTEQEPAAIVVTQDVTALKEAERLKDDFIGIAAHELRNPLAILKGYAQTLIIQTARGNGPKLADWQIEALQSIDQSSLRLVELIDDLLDVTRLQAGRLEIHPEPTNLIALAKRTISRLQVTTDKHSLSLHTSLEHLVLNIDAQRIEQVLSNIISNAIKYSPDGGPIELSISEDKRKHIALIRVADHGIGIPVSQQAHVFGRFMRADNARLHGIGGTGLGLYISRELVERHGGRIWFESTETQGATFYIALSIPQD
jgi:two-component system phosphate regulon sensor histidine kinase PhoR